VAEDLHNLLGIPKEQIIKISAKQGTNVERVLQAIVDFVPPPIGDDDKPLEALIFDSHYDSYKGVVAYVRVFNGKITRTDQLYMMSTKIKTSPVEIGHFCPEHAAGGIDACRRCGLYRYRTEDGFGVPGG